MNWERARKVSRLVIKRAWNRVSRVAPELLGSAALVSLTVTAWVVHPYFGGFTLAGSMALAAWVIAEGRRPG